MMIPIKAMIDRTIPRMISDSEVVPADRMGLAHEEILQQYDCPECKEAVTVIRMTMPFGPQKGSRISVAKGCRCEEIAIVNAMLCRREEIRRQRIYDLFDQNSLINDSLKQATFETFEPTHEQLVHAKKVCLQFAENFNTESSRNLILSGSYGVGKSHLARAITAVIMQKEFTAIFISVPKLLTKLKATYNRKSEHTEDELLSMLEEVDCLVLDDIGAEYGTDHSGSWATSKVFEVVDSRLGKHTIYTTNLTGQELQAKVGPRNFSRMMQDTEVVKMNGEDFRLIHFK